MVRGLRGGRPNHSRNLGGSSMEIYLSILENNSNVLINSKYFKWYKDFIVANKNTNDFEKHHILPKSIYPSYKDDKSNIIKVSIRKHYILHLLLWKIFKPGSIERSKMALAVKRFRKGNSEIYISSKIYESMKRDYRHSKETIEKIRKSNIGKKRSKETIEKLRESHLGNNLPEETKEKLRKINSGKKLSDDHKNKISKSNSGRSVSIKTRMKQSEIRKGKYIGVNSPCYGYIHEQSTRDKMSKAQSLKIWITNGSDNIRVNKYYVLQEGWNYGRYMPKKKGVM